MPQLLLYAAIPTFIGSLSSCLATTAFGILYFIYPPERHFRTALVVNLLLADWVNSLNNTISGAYALSRRHTPEVFTAGPACTLNGWVGQFSVQAIDLNILIISISVLVTVRRNSFEFQPTWRRTLAVCAIPWAFPLLTSIIALGLSAYGPVSGNWCWIKQDRQDLRWGLTHAWRVIIFIATVSIYTYIYIYLSRVYARATGSSAWRTVENNPASQSEQELHTYGDETAAKAHQERLSRETNAATRNKQPSARTRRAPALRKMLLLNGYPLLYIVLWLPGIANRVHEASRGWSPGWLIALQSATQFVGLGNTLTYAFNEQLMGRIRQRYQA